MQRKVPLSTDYIYHIFNKSIERFPIFNHQTDYQRMRATIQYYQYAKAAIKLSIFLRNVDLTKHSLTNYLDHYEISSDPLVEIIAYCLMPTHIHLVLKQLKDNGISHFMRNIQNSYTHYFNERYKRKGPLWIGRFKNVLVESDSQLLHLTRYVHLNPSTAGLTRNPLDWHSSYGEYLNPKTNDRLCHWEELIDLSTSQYRAFVEERIDYQRELAFLKHLSDE